MMTEQEAKHVSWFQQNAASASHNARENMRAMFVAGPTSEWFWRSVRDQEFSATQYAEARRLMGV